MIHVYLPGYSTKNLEEAESISKVISKAKLQVYARKWDHWFDETLPFGLERERDLLIKVLQNFKGQGYGLIAKSVGSLLALEVMQAYGRAPKYLLVMGIPTKDMSAIEFATYNQVLKSYAGPITFIRNSADEVCPKDAADKLFEGVTYTYKEQPAEDHRYNYPDLILEIIKQYDTATEQPV